MGQSTLIILKNFAEIKRRQYKKYKKFKIYNYEFSTKFSMEKKFEIIFEQVNKI